MGSKPTFHLVDDYVALMDLKPAARTVYGLLRCNTSFGRNAVATHTVHVTAAWFTQMTQHWEQPMVPSTARRGLNELIDKGVVIRLNAPQDGAGFLLAFVADPRGRIDGPVNGFDQAKKVARKSGTKALYERKDEIPGTPAVTGVRLGRGGAPDATPGKSDRHLKAPDVGVEDPLDNGSFDEEFGQNFNETPPQPPTPRREAPMDPRVAELARLLVRECHGRGVNRRGLLEGEARRIAEGCAESLDQGWTPERLSSTLASLVSDRIHTIESFLIKKSRDLGSPPETPRFDGTVLIDGEEVDLGEVSWDDLPQAREEAKNAEVTPSPLAPSTDDQAKRERLSRLARIGRSGK